MNRRIKLLTRLKRGLIVGIVIAVVILTYLLLPSSSSKEAFINARVSRVLAQTSGVLTLEKNLAPGSRVTLGQPLGSIKATEANTQTSQLLVQRSNLSIQAVELASQISGINGELDTYRKQLSIYHHESKTQRELEDRQTHAAYLQTQKQLEAAKAKAKFASIQLASFKALYKRQSISRINYQKLRSQARALKASQEALASELKENLLDIKASSVGLQLSGPRTLDSPTQYQRNLSLTIKKMIEKKAVLIAKKQETDINLSILNSHIANQQLSKMYSALNGVIWSIDSETGSTVEDGKPVLNIMDCSDRWVDAFFDESDAGALHKGLKVGITLDSNPKIRWVGTIKTIRAGSGRVTVGDTLVMPPPEIARRQLPVKVVTARIQVQWKKTPHASDFCLAGRSVTVRL